jgi:hypothetical protein
MKLQVLVDNIKNLPAKVGINVQVYENVVWAENSGDLIINTDQSTEDLRNGDNNTYSWEVKGYYPSEDGWALFPDADNGCGYTETIIVKLDEQDEDY